MLKKDEMGLALRDSILDEYEHNMEGNNPGHQFSERFQRKMQKLLNKENIKVQRKNRKHIIFSKFKCFFHNKSKLGQNL